MIGHYLRPDDAHGFAPISLEHGEEGPHPVERRAVSLRRSDRHDAVLSHTFLHRLRAAALELHQPLLESLDVDLDGIDDIGEQAAEIATGPRHGSDDQMTCDIVCGDPASRRLEIEAVTTGQRVEVGHHEEEAPIIVAGYREVVTPECLLREMSDQGSALHPHEQRTHLAHRRLHGIAALRLLGPQAGELGGEPRCELFEQPTPSIHRGGDPLRPPDGIRADGLVEGQPRVARDEGLGLVDGVGERPCRRSIHPMVGGTLGRDRHGDLPGDLEIDGAVTRGQELL